MHTVRHLSIAAAAAATLGLTLGCAHEPEPNPAVARSTQTAAPTRATAQSAQTPAPNPTDTQAAAPSADPDVASGAQKARDSDSVSGVPSIVGLEVISPAGERLGTVITVVASTTGRYAVISTGNDTATAVPYEAVAPMVHDGKVIIDRTKLQNSPQVAQADLHDSTNTKWRQQSDTYWAGQAPGRIRSASPGTNPEQQPRER